MDIATAAGVLNLKKTGKVWKGPCITCGGDDRFRLTIFNGEIYDHCSHECPPGERLKALASQGLVELGKGRQQPCPAVDPVAASDAEWAALIAKSNVEQGKQFSDQDAASLRAIAENGTMESAVDIKAALKASETGTTVIEAKSNLLTKPLQTALAEFVVTAPDVAGMKAEQIDVIGISRGQIYVLVAPPGQGKTLLLFNRGLELARNGFEVVYVNCDVAASDCGQFIELADEAGMAFISPDVKNQSIDSLRFQFDRLADSETRLDNTVVFLDTFKKFVDVNDKTSVKEFINLLRRLNGKGATVVVAHHTLKRREADGSWSFEGVGDVKNDVDKLLFLEAYETFPGERYAVVEKTEHGKWRGGKYEPAYFHMVWNVSGMRVEPTEPVDVRAAAKAKEEMDAQPVLVEHILAELRDGPQSITQLVLNVQKRFAESDAYQIGQKKVSQLIKAMASGPWPVLRRTIKANNKHSYSLTKQSDAAEYRCQTGGE